MWRLWRVELPVVQLLPHTSRHEPPQPERIKAKRAVELAALLARELVVERRAEEPEDLNRFEPWDASLMIKLARRVLDVVVRIDDLVGPPEGRAGWG